MSFLSPVSWAPPVILALLAVTGLADLVLARRYAKGGGQADGGTCRSLILGVQSTLAAGLVASIIGFGTLPYASIAAAVGVVLAIAGWVVRYSAIAFLGRLFTWRVTILDDHRLVDSGPFRHVRHPSYLGGMVHLAGLALLLANWLGLVAFGVVYLPALLRRIAVEEKLLASHFGPAYEAYRARTYRLLPFVY